MGGLFVVRLEAVGGQSREVLARPRCNQAPVRPAQQGLGQVRVVRAALGPARDAEGHPTLVAGGHRHDLDARRLADRVTARRR